MASPHVTAICAASTYESNPDAFLRKHLPGAKIVAKSPTCQAIHMNDICYVAIRGTKPTQHEDLVADLQILRGKLRTTPRYKKAKAFLDKVLKTTRPNKIVLTGHSLGGAIATGLNKSSYRKTVVFNSAPYITFLPNTTEYYVKGDIVSLSNKNMRGKTIRVKQKIPGNAHTIKNFF